MVWNHTERKSVAMLECMYLLQDARSFLSEGDEVGRGLVDAAFAHVLRISLQKQTLWPEMAGHSLFSDNAGNAVRRGAPGHVEPSLAALRDPRPQTPR